MKSNSWATFRPETAEIFQAGRHLVLDSIHIENIQDHVVPVSSKMIILSYRSHHHKRPTEEYSDYLGHELVYIVFILGVYGGPLLQGCDRYVYDTSRPSDILKISCITLLCPEKPLHRPIIAALRVHSDLIPLLHKEPLSRVSCPRYPLHAPATQLVSRAYRYSNISHVKEGQTIPQ